MYLSAGLLKSSPAPPVTSSSLAYIKQHEN